MSGSTLLSRSVLPRVPVPRYRGPDAQSYDNDNEYAEYCPRAGFSEAFRDLFTKEVRKTDVHSDPGDASGERSEHEYVESHPENPGYERRHRHGCHEGMTAEGTVSLGQQFQARFFKSPLMVE